MGIERRALLAGLGALGAAASHTRAKPAAATPVKLTLPWLPLGTYSFAFVARRLGYFAKRGLDVTIARPRSACPSIRGNTTSACSIWR